MRLGAHGNFKPYLAVGNLFNLYLGLCKQALAHEAACCLCDVVARDVDALSHSESGVTYDNVVFIVVGTGYGDSGQLVVARYTVENHRGVIYGVGDSLSGGSESTC